MNSDILSYFFSFPLTLSFSAAHVWHLQIYRSKFVNQPSTRGLHSTGMEGALRTVPSIVVYVTVPNKEAGMKLAESIIKEKLAACVNRVPGM
ncbi:hypothetical protein BHE74_00014169 [Ensete ventricosum]|nr:hypothetical protein BHE74_00014169 [Ensete ventricosum]RZR92183.1 hypothetical protein BHM03_00020443 [Ensete ventricosum]